MAAPDGLPPGPRPTLLYWGRKGLSRFAFELARVALMRYPQRVSLSVSRQNEVIERFLELGSSVLAVETFSSSYGALTNSWRIPRIRSSLVDSLTSRGSNVVVDLMPHVWSPAIAPIVRKAGIPYVAIVHDAQRHPGDLRSFIAPAIRKVMSEADQVITLSRAVGDRLISRGQVDSTRLAVLFHPDLSFVESRYPRLPPPPGSPIRLLFLGRVLPYKGLSLFIEMLRELRSRGIIVAPGVFGEGRLGKDLAHLRTLDAEVVNRWLSEQEIAATLASYHVLVASHTEASQSGIVAAALGAGLPCVVTPVGGLAEQIRHGETGLIASAVSGHALADSVVKLFSEPSLYSTISRYIFDSRSERSMQRFIETLLATLADLSDTPRKDISTL